MLNFDVSTQGNIVLRCIRVTKDVQNSNDLCLQFEIKTNFKDGATLLIIHSVCIP